MPGGRFDSSKTRVAPTFDALSLRGDLWVRDLLDLPQRNGTRNPIPEGLDLAFQRGYWGSTELGLTPPVSLLSWLLRNPDRLLQQTSEHPDRAAVLRGDPDVLGRALDLLRSTPAARAWYILEGPTFPDAVIETRDAVVVVEGKRTERGPTTSTTWLVGRHQMWRHIDAAWERRGCRHVFGFFVVEGHQQDGTVPEPWQLASDECISTASLSTSFPHRSVLEREAIASCFLGVTTWQAIRSRFGLHESVLIPHL